MSFEMQIRIPYTGISFLGTRLKWETLTPKFGYGGNPYRWEKKERAQNMLDLSFPDMKPENKRVIETDEAVNIGNEKDVTGTRGLTVPLYGWERK
jgi:hypothetical protein